mmetsp:Transcript_28842/g.72627  ORF Transcript_28842/g.72627 Transcript_28842/m.72627 type:complete len:208 (+) Transcript_28842:260-883(+)
MHLHPGHLALPPRAAVRGRHRLPLRLPLPHHPLHHCRIHPRRLPHVQQRPLLVPPRRRRLAPRAPRRQRRVALRQGPRRGRQAQPPLLLHAHRLCGPLLRHGRHGDRRVHLHAHLPRRPVPAHPLRPPHRLCPPCGRHHWRSRHLQGRAPRHGRRGHLCRHGIPHGRRRERPSRHGARLGHDLAALRGRGRRGGGGQGGAVRSRHHV